MKRLFLILSSVVVLFGCAVLAVNPEFADIIYDEGGFFENFTVVLCAAAFIFLIKPLAGAVSRRSGYGFWIILAVLVVIFIGDELSWGMLHYGVEKPRIAGVGFDGLHDILSISVGAVKMVRDYVRSAGFFSVEAIAVYLGSFICIFTLILYLVKLAVSNRNNISQFFSRNLKRDPFRFLFIGLILLAVSMFIDDDNLVGFPHKRAVEESLEFIAAASFLCASLSGIKRK